MASNRGCKPNKSAPTGGKPNTPQTSDHSVTSVGNGELDRRVKILEDLVHALQDKENVQIKELQNKVEKLEEQNTQRKVQIENLEKKVMYLQGRDPDESEVEVPVAGNIEETMTNQTDTVVRQDENVSVAAASIQNLPDDLVVQNSDENVTTCTTDLGLQKQEHDSTAASGQVQPIDSANESKNIKEQSSVFSSQSSSHEPKPAACAKTPSGTGRPVARGNNDFTRWMNSTDPVSSVWWNENYSRPLLRYISKMYGQNERRNRVLNSLQIGFNGSPELDQLHRVIRQLAKQPGAKESLYTWQTQTRPDHRLNEIAAMFEYNTAHPSPVRGLKIQIPSPANLEQIISRNSIKGYFDLICRNGLITAEIGEYLHLKKENIFGGNDYDCQNERVTFVEMNLDQSIINLADNRVDLITCLVTLHHVPNLESMLSELVRILRPGGYLLIREHDCKSEYSLRMKYLNFIHAFMMIARVGELGDRPGNHSNQQPNASNTACTNDPVDWERQKSDILNYTNSIQYRSCSEWTKEFERVGFRLKAVFDYDTFQSSNPQALYYAIYQLNAKPLN